MELNRAAALTTSWDDGHPLDLRLAEMLTKYGLRGTFYIPTRAPNVTMNEQQIRELSSRFEIGAHTINHVVLTRTAADKCRNEIIDSRKWVQDLTGKDCPMFCPPEGRFTHEHAAMVRDAGYSALRTVELLSLDFPRTDDGLKILPTTLQACPHTSSTYLKNVAKRKALKNAYLFVVNLGEHGWVNKARSLLRRTLRTGGVFHLWGHSWEIEEKNQWRELDEVLHLMSQADAHVPRLTNSQLCQQPATN